MCQTKSFPLCLLQILVVLGLVLFFLWLSLHPKQPTYAIVRFSVPTTENGNTTCQVNQGGGKNGTISFGLEIRNPNPHSVIYYSDTLLTFYYGKDIFGQKTIPSFDQRGEKTKQMFNENAEARVWKKLVSAISNAPAEVMVTVETRIRNRMWGHLNKHEEIYLQGKIPIGMDGKISGKKKMIRLHQASKKRSKVAWQVWLQQSKNIWL